MRNANCIVAFTIIRGDVINHHQYSIAEKSDINILHLIVFIKIYIDRSADRALETLEQSLITLNFTSIFFVVYIKYLVWY